MTVGSVTAAGGQRCQTAGMDEVEASAGSALAVTFRDLGALCGGADSDGDSGLALASFVAQPRGPSASGGLIRPPVEDASATTVKLEPECDLGVCRVCGDAGAQIAIFDDERTSEKLMTCAAVQVSRGDGLPERICASCSSQLEAAIGFKLRCERSDALFREKLGIRPKTVVKTEFVLIDCDEEDSYDRAGRKIRQRKPLDDDFVHDGDFSDRDSDARVYDEGRKRKTKRRKRHEHAERLKSESDDDGRPSLKKRKANDPTGRYPCPDCDKSFPYPSVLKLHLVTHTKEKIHKCIMCAESFAQSKNLYAHYKQSHPFESTERVEDRPKSYPCGTCDKVFTHGKSLKVHEAMHTRDKKYKCDGCGAGFTNQTILNVHRKREHPQLIPTLSCTYCNRNFKHQSSLERHIDNHKHVIESSSSETKKPQLIVDLFKSIAPVTTTYWSDSFSD